nr:class I SAM-dependent methyltransferase [uncultured Allomuricauda sp.]
MKLFLRTKDFSVSGESFDLHYDAELDMLVTQPQPNDTASYYNSKEYISHTDSVASLTDRLYQWVKRHNIKKKIKLADNQIVKSKKLLDFGAGTGDFLIQSKANGFEINGIEPSKIARDNALKKGIQLFSHPSEIEGEKFDVITLWHVLEHLPNLDDQLKLFKNLLNEDGTLIIAVPNYKSFDAKHYGQHWAAYDVPRHLWHFSKTSIVRLFDKHDMEVISVRPMLFDAFYVSLLSEKYKGSKIYMIKAFGIGLWSNIKAYFSKEYSSLIYIIRRKTSF